MSLIQRIYQKLPALSWEGAKNLGKTYPVSISIALFTMQQYYASKQEGEPSLKKLIKATILGSAIGVLSHFLWLEAQKISIVASPIFSNILPYIGWIISFSFALVLVAEIKKDLNIQKSKQ